MKKVNTTAYHPQTDGLVERLNRSLCEMLAKYGRHYGSQWDKHLPYLLFAYRTRVHSTTRESPFFLLFGRDPQVPSETVLSRPAHRYQVDMDDYIFDLVQGLTQAWKTARETIQDQQKRQKKQYDKSAKTRDFQVGSQVMVFMPQDVTDRDRKLALPHHGPYRVLDVQQHTAKVIPIDQPNSEPVIINKRRLSVCPTELVADEAWIGNKKKNRRRGDNIQSEVSAPQPLLPSVAAPTQHGYPLRNTRARQELQELPVLSVSTALEDERKAGQPGV